MNERTLSSQLLAVCLISFSISTESVRLAMFYCFKYSVNLLTIVASVVLETLVDVFEGLDFFLPDLPLGLGVGAPGVGVRFSGESAPEVGAGAPGVGVGPPGVVPGPPAVTPAG